MPDPSPYLGGGGCLSPQLKVKRDSAFLPFDHIGILAASRIACLSCNKHILNDIQAGLFKNTWFYIAGIRLGDNFEL